MTSNVAEAQRCIEASRPTSPDIHLLAQPRDHLFVVDGSRVYDLTPELAHGLADARMAGAEAVRAMLRDLGLDTEPRIDDTPLDAPPLHALSLAVAQSCNLGCTYCYAEGGQFGGNPTNMTEDVARRAVDRLIDAAPAGARLSLAFLGGEPLINRAVLRSATIHATERARPRGLSIGFAITTNGTLLSESDAEFFETHAFAVTVSLDGGRAAHDAQRPYKGGRGSFDAIVARVTPLLQAQRRMQVSARVTVTPANLDLRETLDQLIALGFHSVGFSPMLSSPTGKGEMQTADLETMLAQMIDCGREFERRTLAGQRYPFANLLSAMKELSRGTHRPYPCGAGAGYLAVSAEGKLSACHRFVGNEAGAMGSLDSGIDTARQTDWLATRHVHRQQPCSSCWARYLCGGGCHHEVLSRGRPACDYVRGWLNYAIEAYLRLSEAARVPAFGGGSAFG